MANWIEIGTTQPYSVGDVIRQTWRVTVPKWVPFNGTLAEFIGSISLFQAEINNRLPNGNSIEIREHGLTEVNPGMDDGQFEYYMVYEVTSVNHSSVQQDPEIHQAGLNPIVINIVVVGLIVFLGLVGISMVLWRTEKLIQQPGGREALSDLTLVAMAGLGILGLREYRKTKG